MAGGAVRVMAILSVRRPGVGCIACLGVAVMFDEASSIELVTKVLVKSVGLWTMVTASDFDADAAVRPSELLGCGNQRATDPALPIVGGDHETRDAAKKTESVKKRNTMNRNDAHDAHGRGRNENGRVGRSGAICDAPLNARDWRRITESSQQLDSRWSIDALRAANNRRRCFEGIISACFHGTRATPNEGSR